MFNRSEITTEAHIIARDEMTVNKISFREAFKIGMKISWRRAKDAARTAETGLARSFQVIEPSRVWA